MALPRTQCACGAALDTENASQCRACHREYMKEYRGKKAKLLAEVDDLRTRLTEAEEKILALEQRIVSLDQRTWPMKRIGGRPG